ncbi:hypothetical protein PRZ48_010006 [Zasmidium cellare]|uniref:Amino-acid acetyltransferase, mitochondrial n=1 Tax=Zasmidium cellare TaxID=395010 RepID=A0ABR0EE11_ZASCE|nr:hypothetical protein PRZ48_010006 [Zasmidium cellare]
MTTSMLACGKANAFGGLKLSFLQCSRQYSNAPGPAVNGKHASRIESPATQRELFVNVLEANATRRDAKQYLSRFKTPRKSKLASETNSPDSNEEQTARLRQDQHRVDRTKVNLGALYAPARAIADTPQFSQHKDVQAKAQPRQELHVALTCLRHPENVDDATLDGLARTLSQLVKLDMKIVVVLDCNGHDISIPDEVRALRKLHATQADRLCDAIDRHNPEGARTVKDAVEVSDTGDVNIAMSSLLTEPLKRGMITVVPSVAVTASGQTVLVGTTDIMLALTKHLAGLDKSSAQREESTSLDRVILLDSAGGIPSKDRGDGAHVFINLQQEFEDIHEELSEYAADAKENSESPIRHTVYEQHQKNMNMMRQCLELLSPASSALIATPHEAATSSRVSSSEPPGTGTRRQRNPLIHNLLTNKPLVSSSLPSGRFSSGEGESTALSAATVLRRGMPVTIVPAAPRATGWQTPPKGITDLRLDQDDRVDLPRLVHLIEDSFRRKLDVQHYLRRVHGRIAGLILAGEYEGGAILTWEMPPGTNDPKRLVPYLDKFAVLQSSQGSSGVADIVFQAMVRTCFPKGVCWRSRKDNPVNKWYFERSAGTWQIPDSNWTMFWTGDGVVENEERWNDYVGVCREIGPSWADGKRPD